LFDYLSDFNDLYLITQGVILKMKKTVIAFDLDGTIAESKSAMTDEMSESLGKLLESHQVCIMSGGKFGQFEKQLISNLKVDADKLERLHLMPTCGTRYYTYNKKESNWDLVYAEDLTPEQKERIVKALDEGLDALGYRPDKTWGETIEDRESQVTLSVLGQDVVDQLGAEGVKIKKAWDPDRSKKKALRDYVAKLLPDLEVRSGGETSIDVTKKGVDKAYGIKKLMDILEVKMEEIMFIGDALEEGGNDYPVKAMGVDSVEVSGPHETAVAIKSVVYCSN
jgi:phosphomannomutase